MIFFEDADRLASAIDWTILEACFGVSLPSRPIDHSCSPFLGGAHLIYKLIVEATAYSRQTHSLAERQLQTLDWLQDLDCIERGLVRYKHSFPGPVGSLYFWKHKLYIIALRVLLAKIADHDLSGPSPVIMGLVGMARSIFEHSDVRETNNPALAWPLIIFLCASGPDAMLHYFALIVEAIRDNFDPGHRYRLSQVIQAVQHRRRGTGPTSDLYEGPVFGRSLDLLIQPGGILAKDPNAASLHK